MSSKNPNKWRFQFETLAPLPTLRLYLFNPTFTPLQCLNLQSHLYLPQSLLLVSWLESPDSEKISVRIPVPRVLIDPDAEVETRVRDDHIEVKMRLVLPVNHPIVESLRGDGGLDRVRPIELADDLKKLTSGNVHLYCNACSTKLTKRPLSALLRNSATKESDGKATVNDLLFTEKYNLAQLRLPEKQCTAAVVSSKLNHSAGNLEEPFPLSRDELSSNGRHGCCPNGHESNDVVNSESDGEMKESNREAAIHDVLFTEKYNLAQLSLHEEPRTLTVDSLKLIHSSGNLEEPIPQSKDDLSSNGHYRCCLSEHEGGQQLLEGSRPERIQKWLHDCSLGSGFFTRSSNLSNDVQWIELLCRNCSSRLGAYPSYNSENAPIDGGIRLYKCYLSTSINVGGPHDLFRKHTLERLFSSMLLEGATDELSYRVVIRDLRSKCPMLQIVLLNSESWCFYGYCSENTTMELLADGDLQPVVKVLFSDCSTASEASSRIIKDWSSKTHTEEVYMMSLQIEELTKGLKSATDRLPRSCSCLQGMSLSSIQR